MGRAAKPSKKLEAFPNHDPERDYIVTLTTDEFTCICPVTGQPDFAKITIRYIPDKKWSSRNRSNFIFGHIATRAYSTSMSPTRS